MGIEIFVNYFTRRDCLGEMEPGWIEMKQLFREEDDEKHLFHERCDILLAGAFQSKKGCQSTTYIAVRLANRRIPTTTTNLLLSDG